MSAAAFVLAINLFVAGMFASAFGVVAALRRSAIGARWLAFSYGFGALNMVLEFVLPYQQDHRLVSFGIFAVFLLALASGVVGLAHHYRVKPPYRLLLALLVASLALNITILDWPRTTLERNILYQLPYALVQTVGIFVVIAHRQKRALDYALLALFVASGLQFLIKPFMAIGIGSGTLPQAYLASNYAAYSQTLGALLLITNGLLLLLIIVRDVMAEITTQSETDTLSGLLNRRGFEEQGDRALSVATRSGIPTVMVVADLDHFKSINDSFGHAAGDQVIAAFAAVLRNCAAPHSVIARLGGEEFAALLPGANLSTGKLFAETVRNAFRTMPASATGLDQAVTASFGVAQLMPTDHLADLMRRADTALYEAKSDGRDCVRLAVADVRRPLEGRREGTSSS
ncbi:diguanylate cyclase (GGDEF) domain-containing protein [Devosia lucknowensis]|uniref:diguanylate cyclase n=1 Tax=Devosia lucknowensis TaxID=1096929 RepID=A0A1Y6G7F8_9HYPH|nr:GGDEF domain-containing protein [Devosia lucknowensis]SMQ86122.1 diguanylate cyclase (GGDEF) domain-containing protein [Devosia lucknowensis]